MFCSGLLPAGQVPRHTRYAKNFHFSHSTCLSVHVCVLSCVNKSTTPPHTSPGPLPFTVVDFWRLVWQERSPTIVMITNLVEGTKIKCHQYWPDKESAKYGPFEVSLIDQQILADYTVRTLILQVPLHIVCLHCKPATGTVCMQCYWVMHMVT